MQTDIYVPVQGGSPPTREGEGIWGEVVRLTPFTFSKPRPHSCLFPSTQLNKKLLSLSRNPEARISSCCAIRFCQANPSTKENRDVCWSLDSRKSNHSHPPKTSQAMGPVSLLPLLISMHIQMSGNWTLPCVCVL